MAVEVWWSSLAAADRDLLRILDTTERARIESLDRPADRGRSLVGAALLRVAVASHLGLAPADVVVDRTCDECGGPHGAPRILGPGLPAPWVSVSHSGVLVVVALSPHGPVGVDVQRLSDLSDQRAGQEWVRREALLKARTAAPEVDQPDATAHELAPPLSGYVAAVVTPAGSDTELRIRHWPPGPGRNV
jgi:4'-phosphopantetheinyl transferase